MFLDVVESVNLLVNSNGTVVRSEVMGALKMRTFLSGMPECKLGLNDKVRGPFHVLPPLFTLYMSIWAFTSRVTEFQIAYECQI